MGNSRKLVMQWQSQSAAARGVAAPPAKVRKKTGEGDWARRKAWAAVMCGLPGVFSDRRLVSVLNQREHHMARHQRNLTEREWGKLGAMAEIRRWNLVLPVRVTLTRYGPKKFDEHDNNRSAWKSVVDGIAEAFKTNDSETGGLSFEYVQQVTQPGHYGARMEFAQAAAPAP